MVLKSWGSILLILMITLAACGTADTPDLAMSDTGVEPSTTPDGASPVPATNVPTERATVEPTATATSKLTAEPTLIKSDDITPQNQAIFTQLHLTKVMSVSYSPITPTMLSSWSPDGEDLLYISNSYTQSLADMGDLASINIHTHIPKLIEKDILVGLDLKERGYAPSYGEPVWLDDCCNIIIRKSQAAPMQHLQRVNLQTQQKIDLGITPRGAIFKGMNGFIVALPQKMTLYSDQEKEQSINFPEIEDINQLRSVTINKYNQLAYTTFDKLVITSLLHPNEQTSITPEDLAALSLNPEFYTDYKEHVQIVAPTWSPDGSMLAFWVLSLDVKELWIVDTTGTHIQPLAFEFFTRGSGWLEWSPDSSMIAYTTSNTDVPPTTTLQIINVERGITSNPIQDVRYRPIWHPKSHQIAILNDIKRDTDGHMIDASDHHIAIYEISER